MKYLILVSHGAFANGLHDALSMLAGKRNDVISAGLENGKSAAEFAENFAALLPDMQADDEIVLLGDLIGGSPLTTAMNVLSEKGLMSKTQVFGGMNLPLALTAVLMKDTFNGDQLAEQILGEAHTGLREFKLAAEEEDEI